MGEVGALWDTPVIRMHLAGRDVAAEVDADTDEDEAKVEEEAPGEEHVEPTAAAAAALESSL